MTKIIAALALGALLAGCGQTMHTSYQRIPGVVNVVSQDKAGRLIYMPISDFYGKAKTGDAMQSLSEGPMEAPQP